MPALLNSTSIRPYSPAHARVQLGDLVLVGDVAGEREVAGRVVAQVDADDGRALLLKRRAVAEPMPPAAPVMTHTLRSSRLMTPSRSRRS